MSIILSPRAFIKIPLTLLILLSLAVNICYGDDAFDLRLEQISKKMDEARSNNDMERVNVLSREYDKVRLEQLDSYEAIKKEAHEKYIKEEEARKRENDAQVAEEKKIQDELERKKQICYSSKKYLLYEQQEMIIIHNVSLELSRNRQKFEREISNESGMVNKSAVYAIGKDIVVAKRNLNEAWNKYKRLGGKASSPSKVSHSLKNPCDNLQAEEEQHTERERLQKAEEAPAAK